MLPAMSTLHAVRHARLCTAEFDQHAIGLLREHAVREQIDSAPVVLLPHDTPREPFADEAARNVAGSPFAPLVFSLATVVPLPGVYFILLLSPIELNSRKPRRPSTTLAPSVLAPPPKPVPNSSIG